MVDADTDRTGPGDRDRRLQKRGSQVAARLADVLRGLLPHGGQASVSVLPPEPGLGSVLAAHHLPSSPKEPPSVMLVPLPPEKLLAPPAPPFRIWTCLNEETQSDSR